jgi:hypothetical protein
MPSYNLTVPNTSPLIRYEGGRWIEPSVNDPTRAQSATGTYRMTNGSDATATFLFEGTGVWIYGGKRPDHGAPSSHSLFLVKRQI